MNKLQLCQRLRSLAGIAGSGPTTTIGQTGELGRIVDWIDEAYEDIQGIDECIYFLRGDFSGFTVAGTSIYQASDFGINDVNNWKKDSLRCWLNTYANERYLIFRDWEYFRDTRIYTSVRDQTGLPIEFSIQPDNRLVFWPKPDQIYTIVGEYFKLPHVMSLDTDSPIFNPHQLIIVFDALTRYAAFNSEPALYAYAQNQYSKLRGRLGNRANLAPAITTGPALA